MQVEEVCFPLFLCQQTMFQGCNVKRRGSGSLGVSWILGAAWSSQLWGPHPIPRTPIPYWEGKCHHEGTVCSGHVGSVGIVRPGGDFCFSRPDPTPHESILRDDLLGLCLFISPSDREAFTCFKAPQLLPPELPVLFFWAALLCASRKNSSRWLKSLQITSLWSRGAVASSSTKLWDFFFFVLATSILLG